MTIQLPAETLKADAARRQLGTALKLFLDSLDPVSVHALAAGGGEVASRLAEKSGARPWVVRSLEVHPELDRGRYLEIRNQRWNALKHATQRYGKDRDDEALLNQPMSTDNEALLVSGWFDLAEAGIPLPIEVQVFFLWYLAKNPLVDEEANQIARETFPRIFEMTYDDQKRALREKIEWARTQMSALDPENTDHRPLILPE